MQQNRPPPRGSSRPKRQHRARQPGSNRPELLGSLLANARATTAKAARAGPVDQDTWRRIVGDRVAQRTEPGRVVRGTLQVRVTSPVWAQELSFFSEEIVARLRRTGVEVDSIRFAVARLDPQPLPLPPAARRVHRSAVLPEPVQERLAQIQDPELRAAIREAASQSLALQQAATTSPRRAARGPRSAAPGSARPDRSAAAARAARQRKT
jgi:hypothetical protein